MSEMTLSDPSALKRLSNILQWVAIGLVFCGGFVQILRFVVDQKERAISRDQSLEKERQQQGREAALRADLEKSKSDLEVVATRDVFRPLAAPLRIALVASLRELQAAAAATPLEVAIYVEAGSKNRALLMSEMLGVMRDAGINASEGGAGTTFATGPLPAISFEIAEETLPIANALAERLGAVVKAKYHGKKVSAPVGSVTIWIHGEPEFDAEGVVVFR